MHAKRMMFLVSSVLFFAFSFVPVFAQTNDPGKMENVIVIATTNITEAKVTKQENTVLEVTYTVNNETGIQTDIRASLGLLDAKNAMVEEQRENAVFSLGENEEKVRTVTIEIPTFLKGEFTPVVSLATEAGLFLSMHPLEEKITVSGTDSNWIDFQACYLTVTGDEKKYFAGQGVDVAANEELLAHCSAQNMSAQSQTVTPSIAEYRRSSFGKKMNEYKVDPVTFASSEKKEIVFTVVKNSEPQAYTQKVALLNENGKKVSNETSFHYVLQGESATIQNIVLDKNAYKKGEVATITFTSSSSADRFIGARRVGGTPFQGSALLRIVDGNGVACATEKTTPFQSDIFQKETITLEKDCSNPSVFASIQNNEGKVLDSREVSVNNPSSEHKESATSVQGGKEDKKTQYFTFIGIGIFVTLFCLLVVLAKKLRTKSKKIHMVLFFVFASALGIGSAIPNEAKATTYGAYSCSGYCILGMSLTIDTGRKFYPGQGIWMPVRGSMSLCSNALNYASVWYGMNGGSGTIFNGSWGYNSGYDGTYNYDFGAGGVAPDNLGNYYAGFGGSFREEHCGWYGAVACGGADFCCPGWLAGTQSYSFNVGYSVIQPPPMDGECKQNMSPSENEPVDGCSKGKAFSIEYKPETGEWIWICKGLWGGKDSGECSVAAKPKVDFWIQTVGGNHWYSFDAIEGAIIDFSWKVSQANQCSVSGNSSDLVFQNPYRSNSEDTQEKTVNAIVGSGSGKVNGTYTLTCSNKSRQSVSKKVQLNATCRPYLGNWGECLPKCSQDEKGKISRDGINPNCSPRHEEKDCSVPQCQPGGFQEVKP